MNVAGGEARFLATLPRTVTALWDLGDGRLLLKTTDPRKGERFEDADYMVFQQIPFNSNGKGFKFEALAPSFNFHSTIC